jgi:hypothetical protein
MIIKTLNIISTKNNSFVNSILNSFSVFLNFIPKITKIFILIFTFFALTTNFIAEENIIPMNIQIPIFLKILTFEKKISEKKEVNILIVHQSKYTESLTFAEETMQIIQNSDSKLFAGIKFYPKYVNIDNTSDISNYLSPDKPNVIIMMPVRAINLTSISKQCNQKKILSLVTVSDYLDSDFSVAIKERRNKPEIWVNLNSVKNEGALLNSQLLKLVKIKE